MFSVISTQLLNTRLFQKAVMILVFFGLSFISITPSNGQTPTGPDQSPSVTPTSSVPIVCPPNLPPEMPGGRVAAGNLSITLPAGRFAVLESPPSSGNMVICNEAGAGVRLSGTDCRELGRIARSDEDNRRFDQIVASCSVGAPISTPNTATSGIRPPATGTGGLLNQEE